MQDDRLKDIARIYPAVLIRYEDGTQTTISIEWYEQNSSSVEFLRYALIFLFKDGSKAEEYFSSEQDMHEALQSYFDRLQSLKK